jgi:hypothetical protein
MLVSNQTAAEESESIRDRFPFEPERVCAIPQYSIIRHYLTV